ncbi:hypothetical protein DNHGIG_11960 [Collibacillus ludicampi]|uniref:SLH domain-containing protein n=1 Tax=Collibacillus ludicampi TaxID=2771369 RepID=A0AAV4LCW8_9BACL|nr:S-layer homology domain-containing protein [Collibacillus ludicampi]GIM45647.1 hypothetical protein DNHGIG_11960 [Collibacillus ludicampi]
MKKFNKILAATVVLSTVLTPAAFAATDATDAFTDTSTKAADSASTDTSAATADQTTTESSTTTAGQATTDTNTAATGQAASDNTATTSEQESVETSASLTFKDIDQASTWARDLIITAQKLGLMAGDKAGTFRPRDTVTRQEVAAILVNTLKLKTPDLTKSSFSDVTSSDWGMKQIEAVAKAGLMVGDKGGTFRPHDPVTREEMATILVHAAGGTAGKGDNLKIADKDDVSDWAKGYVQAAMEMGLMAGDGTNFHPKDHAERQEVAAMLLNFLKVKSAEGDNFTPALSAVNHAADASSMRTALEENAAALGIDVSSSSAYGKLKVDRKPAVALDVYENRPEDGFQTVDDVKTLFDRVVKTRTVIEQALDSVNSAISVDEIAAMNRSFITDVIADLEDAQKTPNFVYESDSKISDTLATLKDLVTKYDALTDQEKQEANAAIQGKSFTSYNAMIQAFAKAVDKQKAALDAVNTATDAASMKSALETNAAAIGIDVSATSDYGKLIGDATVTQDVYANQLSVAQDVYDNKPNGGYTNVADVKSVFDAAVQVKTAQVNALKDVQSAKSADDLADVKYINDAIAALEDASKTANYTTSSGRNINDILDELKADVTQYTALTDEEKKAVNEALAGKTFTTYSDLVQAFEEAVKANTANDSSAQGSQSTSTGTTSGTQTTDTQSTSTSDSTQSTSGEAASTQIN